LVNFDGGEYSIHPLTRVVLTAIHTPTRRANLCRMKKQNSTQAAIHQTVRRIVERFDPEQVILFGSHARGVASRDSDVDLLVVMKEIASKRAKQVEMRCALHDIRIPKDIIVVTTSELERHRNVVGTVVRPALLEGKSMYVRGG